MEDRKGPLRWKATRSWFPGGCLLPRESPARAARGRCSQGLFFPLSHGGRGLHHVLVVTWCGPKSLRPGAERKKDLECALSQRGFAAYKIDLYVKCHSCGANAP